MQNVVTYNTAIMQGVALEEYYALLSCVLLEGSKIFKFGIHFLFIRTAVMELHFILIGIYSSLFWDCFP